MSRLNRLEFLDHNSPSGAVFVVDDYDFFSAGAKTAVDEFVTLKNSKSNHYLLEIPDKKFGCFAILKKVA